MHAVRSLIDLLRDRAATQPDDPAYTFLDDGERPGASVTWSRLERRSRAIAVAIRHRVDPGARVVVMFPPSLDFVPAFFGVLFAGGIAVPAYPPAGARADRTSARLRGMIVDADVTLALASDGAALARIPGRAGLELLDPATVPDDLADDWREPRLDSASLAFLQYTSGSTAAPRGVMVSHGNLLDNLAQTAAYGEYDANSVSVSWLPVTHDMGLINGVLQALFSGIHAHLMAPAAFLQRPARWLQAISRFGATHSGGPNFAYDLCVRRISDEDASTLELGCWRVAYNGSEPVRRATLEEFQRKFGPYGFRWETFSPAYGLAESTLFVTGVPAGAAPVLRGDAVASGFAAVGSRIVIVDPNTRTPLAESATGEIWVSGPSVARGYWKREEETAEIFHAFTSDSHGPFLRTGDLGFTERGRLFVTGRLKDVLIVRGVKHYPQDLELTAEHAHPALRPGCCAAFAVDNGTEERIAIIAELDPRECRAAERPDLGAIVIAIRMAIASAHHVSLFSVSLVEAGTLPKTTSGKLQRYLCREALLHGSLDPVASWDADSLAEQIAS